MANVQTEVQSDVATGVAKVDMKLEIIVIPVSDVDRAKEFLREAWMAASMPTMPRITSA